MRVTAVLLKTLHPFHYVHQTSHTHLHTHTHTHTDGNDGYLYRTFESIVLVKNAPMNDQVMYIYLY